MPVLHEAATELLQVVRHPSKKKVKPAPLSTTLTEQDSVVIYEFLVKCGYSNTAWQVRSAQKVLATLEALKALGHQVVIGPNGLGLPAGVSLLDFLQIHPKGIYDIKRSHRGRALTVI